MTILLAVWSLGTLVVLGRWARRAASLGRALRHAAEQAPIALGDGRSVRVYRTHENIEPGVVGLFRAALLLPVGLESRLSKSQLEAVLAHELSHIRRRDNLTAAVHMLVEAVFWFHPMVWWVGRRLVDERERACDEMVVGLGHDRATYAESILNVCEHYAATRLACAPGISGSDLKRRIIEIMRYPGMRRLRLDKKLLLTVTSLAALAVPVLAGLLIDSVAIAQQSEANPLDPGEFLPLVKTAPVYPPQAVADGIEGTVVVEYTILATGSTANVHVVESTDPIFNQSAIDSAQKYKYKPRVVNGEAVSVDGVRTKIVFALEADAPAVPPAPAAPPAPPAPDNQANATGGFRPLTVMPPVYPPRAAARGIEGYVLMQLTVATDGTTKDIRVLDSSSTLFEHAAVEAVEQYRYSPRIVNGQPIEVQGLRTRINFELPE